MSTWCLLHARVEEGGREGLVRATLPHCHCLSLSAPDQIMFSHLKVGPGTACTGQVKLCSDTAGSTLLEACLVAQILTLKDGIRGGAFLQLCQDVLLITTWRREQESPVLDMTDRTEVSLASPLLSSSAPG